MWIGLFDKIGYFDQIAIADDFFGLLLAAYFAPLAALAVHDLPSRRLIHAAEELTLLRTIAGESPGRAMSAYLAALETVAAGCH